MVEDMIRRLGDTKRTGAVQAALKWKPEVERLGTTSVL